MKKKLVILLSLAMLASALNGCKRKDTVQPDNINSEPDQSCSSNQPADNTSIEPPVTSVTTGRYIAKLIPSSVEMMDESLQYTTPASQHHADYITECYAFSNDYHAFYRFRLEDDQIFHKTDMSWAVAALPADLVKTEQVTYRADGTGYLFCYTADDENHDLAHIIKQSSELTGEELDIPYLRQQNAQGNYPHPQSLTVDCDGTLYLMEDGTCRVFDPNTYTLEREYTISPDTRSIYLTDDSVYMVSPSDSTITEYNKSSGRQTNVFAYESINPYDATICVDTSNQLCLLIHEGLFLLMPDDTWKMIYDGSLGILSAPDVFASALIPGKDNDFYFALTGTTPSIYHCFFDPNIGTADAKGSTDLFNQRLNHYYTE